MKKIIVSAAVGAVVIASSASIAYAKHGADDTQPDDNHSRTSVTAPTPTQTEAVATTVSRADAIAIATAQFPGATLKKVERETEHGSLVYSVRFHGGARVDVLAETGSIVRVESK